MNTPTNKPKTFPVPVKLEHIVCAFCNAEVYINADAAVSELKWSEWYKDNHHPDGAEEGQDPFWVCPHCTSLTIPSIATHKLGE